MNHKIIEVVAAIIVRQGRVLVCSRPKKSALAGFWEFPGGKQEPGETLREALVREIREELALEISVQKSFWRMEHDYGDKYVRVTFFFASMNDPSAELQPKDDQDMRWVFPRELSDVPFLPADLPVSSALRFCLEKNSGFSQ